jgi:uncharacterized protein with GYD domain
LRGFPADSRADLRGPAVDMSKTYAGLQGNYVSDGTRTGDFRPDARPGRASERGVRVRVARPVYGEGGDLMRYLIVGQHPPDLCPSANEKIRALAAEGGQAMPDLAEQLGVKILDTFVPMTNHQVYVAVEADDANSVREFAFQGRLGQWNTIEILQVSTLEEALIRVQDLPTIY